jgi:hypothetical protein
MAVIPETAPAPASGVPRWRRFLTPWRSPADQPAWARPALLAIAAVAAVAYGWGMAGASVEPFYGAAARSMSESWHDFIFGAFDPAGTVTIDKLPGELWVQALSLRIFGFHIWALVLPQVVEGVLTILVLYRAVRRLAGPTAGLTAAALLLPAAASVSCVIRGLGPFDTPFESSKTAHNNQLLAADAPRLTRAVQRLEQQTPPGDALLGTDTSGLAQNYILYSGREVLPIGGYLGNVPAPTLATLQEDISRGYVRVFLLPVSPPGPDPRVRWLESHCTTQPQPPNSRPAPAAAFFCGLPTTQPATAQPAG